MKTFVLVIGLLYIGFGRGYITVNTERFSEYINDKIENNPFATLSKEYKAKTKYK